MTGVDVAGRVADARAGLRRQVEVSQWAEEAVRRWRQERQLTGVASDHLLDLVGQAVPFVERGDSSGFVVGDDDPLRPWPCTRVPATRSCSRLWSRDYLNRSSTCGWRRRAAAR